MFLLVIQMVNNLVRSRYQNTDSCFLNTMPSDYQFTTASHQTYNTDISQTRRIETDRRYLTEK